MAKPINLNGFFKRGSSWNIRIIRKDSEGTAINMTGMTTRAMFRPNDIYSEEVVTLTGAPGIVVTPVAGQIDLMLSKTQTALFVAGDKVYFDVEQTLSSDPNYAWQSPTYYLVVEEEVTRDD